MKLKKYIKYTLRDICESLEFERFRFYRALVGGKWYKHQMNGELPNCYGAFWAQYGKIDRYTDIIKEEDYTKNENK